MRTPDGRVTRQPTPVTGDPMKKTIADSRVELNTFTRPEHANLLGNVHGGEIMKLVDEAGALCAMRHAQNAVVTVAIDSMTFVSPVRIGDVILMTATLKYVGRTSMEVEIQVRAEDPLLGATTHTNSAYAVYVALDKNGRPTKIPGLVIESPEEKAGAEAAQQRQALRLKYRAKRD